MERKEKQIKNGRVNAKQILAAGISVTLIIAAIAVYQLGLRAGRVAENISSTPVNIVNRVVSFLQTAFDKKVTVTLQNDVLSIKPIGELALAKVRVRAIENYRDTYLGSEKVIIAHEAYDLKIGWDLNSDIQVTVGGDKTIHISAAKPHILSCERADSSPTILYRSDGLMNKLTPEDMITVQQHMDEYARTSEEARLGMQTAMNGFKEYFSALFQAEGYKVDFDFERKSARAK